MQTFLIYFTYFISYSFIGWLAETLFIYIKTNKLVDRGFLIGPYCPIYGFGCIAMILYLTQYKNNILTVFILGVVICSILEYFTSYIMEKLFKTRWWDYSTHKYNLNGRICGENCLLFGLGGIAILYIIHPLLTKLINKIPTITFIIITIILLIIITIDFIISLKVIKNFKKTLTTIDLKKDSTTEFTKAVKQTINIHYKILEQRLIRAFPNINFQKLNNIKNEIKQELTELKEGIKEEFEEIKEKIRKDD